MIGYECSVCGGLCDPGELENGVCHECRMEAESKQEQSREASSGASCAAQERYLEQADGQLALKINQEENMATGTKIAKLKIRNIYGITEFDETGGKSLELTGANGVGKTSVLDAIKYALTNKSTRKYVVRNGETEGEILIETDTGLSINRKARTNQSDYKSIKQNGREVPSPETFLKDIFTQLQLNPVEFIGMSEKEQNAIILDMIEYPWNLDTIRGWFGELPAWVNYDQNILCVLNDIQSEKGDYYQNRRDIDRDIRNKKAFVEEIAASLPVNYDADKWEHVSAGDIYQKIERIQRDNENIQKSQMLKSNRDAKVRKFEADREIQKSAIDREYEGTKNRIEKDILKLQEQIRALEAERDGLAGKREDKVKVIESQYKASVAQYDAEVEAYSEYQGMEPMDISELMEQASEIEKMKSHINEYRRMVSLQETIEELEEKSRHLTEMIEKARTLPGEILANCTIPIEGLTVKDGVPLINGLPVSNLSDGQKLDLCIDVAIQNPAGLQIILIDGAEKLSSTLREKLYKKCLDKGLQYIATRTTDDTELTVYYEG